MFLVETMDWRNVVVMSRSCLMCLRLGCAARLMVPVRKARVRGSV